MMDFIPSDTLRLAIVPELTPGTTPDAPAFQVAPITGETLSVNFNTTESAQLGGPSRGRRDSIVTGLETGGALNFELVHDRALESLLAGLFGTAWAGNELVVGNTIPSFSIEKGFLKPDGDIVFQRYTGCMVNGASLTIAPEEIITGSFDLIGRDQVLATEPIADAAYTGPSNKPVMRGAAKAGIELLDAAGAAQPWADEMMFTQLGLTFSNNGRGLKAIGHDGNVGQVLGAFTVEASFTAYFTSNRVAQLMRDQAEIGLRITLHDSLDAGYTLLLPRCKLTTHTSNAGGAGQDVVDTGTITALTGAGATPWVAKLTRTGAAA